MLDPITSLLATCVNCNSPSSITDQPMVATCDAEQRSNSNTAPHHTLTDCISPPEVTPESLGAGSSAVAFVQSNSSHIDLPSQSTQPQPAAPESVVLVSWSNSSTSTQAAAAANLTARTVGNSTTNSTTEPVSGQNYQLLRLGSQGRPVVQLQTKLKQLGLYRGTVDGIFGAQTKAAVAQFQRSKGLQADGVVGTNTWQGLQAVVSPPSQSSTSPVSSERTTTQTAQTAQPVQSAPAQSAQSAPGIAAAQPRVRRSVETAPTSPLSYLWILGWGIIYGSGWIFILKDTVKELQGFHFVLGKTAPGSKTTTKPVKRRATDLQRKNKVAPVVVFQRGEAAAETIPQSSTQAAVQTSAQTQTEKNIGNGRSSTARSTEKLQTAVALESPKRLATAPSIAAPTVPSTAPQPVPLLSIANAPTVEQIKQDSHNHSSNGAAHSTAAHSTAAHSTAAHSTKVEPFALQDPWYEENEAPSVQILNVALADGGQVQPIQNVFVVAPRPKTTSNRKRVKKPAPIIYDVKSIRQKVKTG